MIKISKETDTKNESNINDKCCDCEYYHDDEYEEFEICYANNDEYIGRHKPVCSKFKKRYKYG